MWSDLTLLFDSDISSLSSLSIATTGSLRYELGRRIGGSLCKGYVPERHAALPSSRYKRLKGVGTVGRHA